MCSGFFFLFVCKKSHLFTIVGKRKKKRLKLQCSEYYLCIFGYKNPLLVRKKGHFFLTSDLINFKGVMRYPYRSSLKIIFLVGMHKIEEESTLAAWRRGETDMLKIKRNSAHRICLFWRFWKQRVPVYSLCVMPWNSVLQSGSSTAPYITYEQGNTLMTCCSKKLEATMVPKFPLVSIPRHLMGPRACGREPTVTTMRRGG